MIKTDSQEKIVLAKLANLLKKYSYRIFRENGDGDNLLRCCGLSTFADAYSESLKPYFITYYGRKYDNDIFNPGECIYNVCLKISDDKEALGRFLSEFIRRIREIDKEDISVFENYLEVLGYKLNVDKIYNKEWKETTFKYSLAPFAEGIIERQKDMSYLLSKLSNESLYLVSYYENAISTYGNSEYKSCIESCRTLIEVFFKNLSNNNLGKGVLSATNEVAPEGYPPKSKLNKFDIFKFWIEKTKGFNRYRFIISAYSLMSGLGTHAEEKASKADALLCLRVTEDILLWYFQNTK